MNAPRAPRTVEPSREWITDERLPGLATMLDVERVGGVIQAAHPDRPWDVIGCEIEYLRYKPQTNCLISYRVSLRDRITGYTQDRLLYGKCFTPEDYELAHAKAAARQWVSTSTLDPWLAWPEIPALLYTFPNDAQLFGLEIAADSKKLQRLLYEHPGPYTAPQWRLSDRRLLVRTVRYKPEKRAVLHLQTRAVHKVSGAREDLQAYLRTYADDRGAGIHRLMGQLRDYAESGAGPQVPAPYGYVAERRLLLLQALPGRPLLELLQPSLDTGAVAAAGAALAGLHRCQKVDVPARSATSLFEEVRSSGAALGRVWPDAAPAIGELLAALADWSAASPAAPMAFVHGDFHHGQVLIHEGLAALLDFDRSYRGDPTADLGNFCAHAHSLQHQGRVHDARALSEALLAGYERAGGARLEQARLAYWTVTGLLQLAVHPFRSLQPGWRETTRSILDLCASLLP